jgi:hypothetical protein
MRSIGIAIALLVAIGSMGIGIVAAHKVALRDDCDPEDEA